MIVPTKYNGYARDGTRLYHFGGGGGGGEPAPPPPPPRLPSAAPPPAYTTYGSGDRTGSLVQSGNSFRPSAFDYSRPIYDPNYADNITGYQQSCQFYQPIFQPQYQNYNMGNSMGVSQYGQQPSYGGGYGGGYGGYGGFGGFGGGFGGMSQMQSPFNYQQITQQRGYAPNQRTAPNMMRRAEGGIASLMDDAE